jgi:hypothetical protein
MDHTPSLGRSQSFSDVESVPDLRTYGSPSMSSNDMNSSRTSTDSAPIGSYKYDSQHDVHSMHQNRGTGNNMSVYAMLSPTPSYAGQNFGR